MRSIEVGEGTAIAAGAALARLDASALEERRKELVAQREEARARLVRAEATFDRIAALVPQAATRQQLDDARAEGDAARAAVRRVAAAIDVIDVSIDKSVLRAPFSGEVVIRYVDEGAVVGAGQSIVRINAGGPIEAEIGISARFRRQIEIGAIYQFEAGDQKGAGRATRIVNDINVSTQTIAVVFEIVEDPGFVPSDLVRLSLD